jgi:hypothetical protein
MDDARPVPVPTIPKVISIGLKLLNDGDSHSIEQQYPLILRSLHDQQQQIPLPSRLELERTCFVNLSVSQWARGNDVAHRVFVLRSTGKAFW